MENENIVKDYGSVTLPKDWNEVTLKQYAEICAFYQSDDRKFDIRDVLHIFTGLPEDDINDMPVEFVEKMLEHLQFMQNEPKIGEPTNTLEIKGTKYTVNIQSKMKTGEYIAVTEMMKSDKYNYPLFLAILCRKPGELYDSKYENEVISERLEMFSNIPMTEGVRVINFFLQCWMASIMPTRLSSVLREEINHIRKDIESSVKSGEVTKRSMKSAMKTLRKLENTINTI